MTLIQWKMGASGQWIDGSNWDGGTPPGPLDAADLSVAGTYVVSLSSAISIASLAIGDSGAALELEWRGGGQRRR